MLTFSRIGAPSDRTPLLIAHGLYGSGRNWGVIAKRLSDEREVITVDMRNHAGSFWSDDHSYADLAGDLAEVIEANGAPMHVLGHSMGGKAAMTLALTHPELVQKLIVADIAPVAYGHDRTNLIEAMRRIDPATVSRRSEADALLAESVPDGSTRAFLLQSLDLKEGRWTLNFDALAAAMPQIVGWPEIGGKFDHPTLFLSGKESDYVKRESRDKIKSLFPNAYFAAISGAGHWLHAEKPREFEASVRVFLAQD